uniref:Uncharacterized protein n=1 Tax=Branchiostoma floridae TaxID=7739 RepID=C3XPK5_BRAFL|eukprot:XP_002613867.1 hypothetical protein BRAFLDRAFT_72013 [Branchiostoma floridae]
MIASAADIGSVLGLVWLSYYGGRPGANRPKILGICTLIFAIGTFAFGLPHLMTPAYEVTSGGPANGTQDIPKDVCTSNQTTSTTCAASKGSSSSPYGGVYAVLLFAQFLQGIGIAPTYPLGTTYVDDHVTKKALPFYLALKKPMEENENNEEDGNKMLPGTEAQEPPSTFDPAKTLKQQAKDIMLGTKKVLSNWLFMCITMAFVCYNASGSTGPFIPKYMETQLGMHNAQASYLLAYIPAPIYIGALIDSSCELWSSSCGVRGACLLYDMPLNRLLFVGVQALLTSASIILLCVAIHLYNRREAAEGKSQAPGLTTRDIATSMGSLASSIPSLTNVGVRNRNGYM